VQDSLISNVYIGFGLGYSSYSTEGQLTDKTSEDGILTGSYYNSYGYVNAPLSITYRSKTTGVNSLGFFGEFQLTPSYNVNATQKETPGGSALTLDTTTSSLVSIKNQTHAFSLMMGVSGGLLIGMNNMILMVGPYYTTSLSDITKSTSDYTMVEGKTESYTPTLMKSIGVSITVAIKINTHAKKLSTVATTNGAK
jgi:YD repeat-containing protein